MTLSFTDRLGAVIEGLVGIRLGARPGVGVLLGIVIVSLVVVGMLRLPLGFFTALFLACVASIADKIFRMSGSLLGAVSLGLHFNTYAHREKE